MKRTIFLGADHAGFALKEALLPYLANLPLTIVDLSPKHIEDDDYPLIAKRVAQRVVKTPNARGILVCGSGVGVTIAANRIKKIRAFDAFDEETTEFAREHNDANIISLSGWRLEPKKARELIQLFLDTKPSSLQRHKRRIKQLG